MLTACQSQDGEEEANKYKILETRSIQKLIPARVAERNVWATDVRAIMDELKIERNLVNTCSIIAVVDQESNFIADPMVPGLGKKAIKEMNERLTKKLGAKMAGYFDDMLQKYPTPDDNFFKQLEAVTTERELDQLYREMFAFYTKKYNVSLLAGAAKIIARQDLAEAFNPVRTLGSMQVNILYASENARSGGGINKLRDDLYTQYGGLYYGIHRLMVYPTHYDKAIYRFADYNSGMYSSRNASIQKAIAKLSGQKLALDGDLLSYDKDGDALAGKTDTENLLNDIFVQNALPIDADRIRKDLRKEKQKNFEETATYLQIRQLYQEKFKQELPYAIMPEVVISGPKLSRDYNTNWFASRVNQRYTRCINNGKRMGFKLTSAS
jgi:hypothetical protein